MRPIDADEVYKVLTNYYHHRTEIQHKALKEAIERVPTADAEPVRHGRWETDGISMDDGEYLMTRCTVCGTPYEYGHNDNYCGYCGAKMDGERKENGKIS